MFKKIERTEIKEINSIPIGYGILYTLFLSKVEQPITAEKEVEKEINGKVWIEKMKFTTFQCVNLVSFAIDSEVIARKKDISILESLDKNREYDMDLSPTIGNTFMDLMDKKGININQKFLLKKEKTDNKFKPKLIIEKI